MPQESENPRITFVERDTNLNALLEFSLSHVNYKTREFDDPEKLFSALKLPGTMVVVYNTEAELPDSPKQKKVKIGKIRISFKKRRVKVNGEDMHFTKQEFDILSLLYEYRDQVVGRAVILEHIWGTSYSDTNVVATNISTIRAKLGKHADVIKTIRGVGYMLTEDDE